MQCKTDVRFTPESGHVRGNEGCPLWAKSGLMRCINDRSVVGALGGPFRLSALTLSQQQQAGELALSR